MPLVKKSNDSRARSTVLACATAEGRFCGVGDGVGRGVGGRVRRRRMSDPARQQVKQRAPLYNINNKQKVQTSPPASIPGRQPHFSPYILPEHPIDEATRACCQKVRAVRRKTHQ